MCKSRKFSMTNESADQVEKEEMENSHKSKERKEKELKRS